MALNEKSGDLITEADEICESEKQEDKDRYEVIKENIAMTRAKMEGLFDW